VVGRAKEQFQVVSCMLQVNLLRTDIGSSAARPSVPTKQSIAVIPGLTRDLGFERSRSGVADWGPEEQRNSSKL
jgi:hypothetical protein